MAGFDIKRFVALSKAVDLSDIDFDEAARVGITSDEARILRYMADTETHTILYLRDLLAGHTARDGEVTQFLSCWVYEELNHGRAIDRFLAAVGHPAKEGQYEEVTAAASTMETVEAVLSQAAAYATRHFAATHMVWGALNEATAAAAYTALARTTRNKPLAKLVTKLAKDERKHYSFYYHQAEKRLAASPVARAIAKFAMSRFWGPVGIGVGGTREVIELIFALYFSDPAGSQEMTDIDVNIAKLPGMEWFHRLGDWRDKSIALFREREAARWKAITQAPEYGRRSVPRPAEAQLAIG